MSVLESIPPAVIEASSFLTLHYRMAGPDGVNIINTFGGKPATLSLGRGELSPAIEERLLGLPEGTRTSFELPAGVAFGERKLELVQWVARKLLNELGNPDEQYQLGDVVQFPTPDGMGQYAGSVQQIKTNEEGKDDAVQFDFNHPLAGQTVVFELHHTARILSGPVGRRELHHVAHLVSLVGVTQLIEQLARYPLN